MCHWKRHVDCYFSLVVTYSTRYSRVGVGVQTNQGPYHRPRVELTIMERQMTRNGCSVIVMDMVLLFESSLQSLHSALRYRRCETENV